MKDNFLLKQLAQAVVDCFQRSCYGVYNECAHCLCMYSEGEPHKPHCIVLVAEQILKGSEDE